MRFDGISKLLRSELGGCAIHCDLDTKRSEDPYSDDFMSFSRNSSRITYSSKLVKENKLLIFGYSKISACLF